MRASTPLQTHLCPPQRPTPRLTPPTSLPPAPEPDPPPPRLCRTGVAEEFGRIKKPEASD